jgi:splicing factor 1
MTNHTGHRRWDCPAQRMYSANVICRLCGGGKLILSDGAVSADNVAGHMARDCRGRGDPNMAQNKQTQFDSEYSALMAELGEGAAPGAANVPAGAVTAPPAQDRLPPWRIPENWMPGEFYFNPKSNVY